MTTELPKRRRLYSGLYFGFLACMLSGMFTLALGWPSLLPFPRYVVITGVPILSAFYVMLWLTHVQRGFLEPNERAS